MVVASGINVLAGIWLIIAPFVLGYSGGDPYWNDIVFGAIVAVLALARVSGAYRASWLSWLNMLIGAWIFASAFWLDDTTTVTCLFTRVGFRKRGVSRALARAAVDFARERGARAIEGYPITTKDVLLEELHVGTESVFADAGLSEVGRPTKRRVVMRLDF